MNDHAYFGAVSLSAKDAEWRNQPIQELSNGHPQGCVNDAKSMTGFLHQLCGLTAADITLLVDAQVTKNNIMGISLENSCKTGGSIH